MVYLIEYDRNRGRVVTLRAYEDIDRRSAEEARLRLELSLNGAGIDREVVLLEALDDLVLIIHDRHVKRNQIDIHFKSVVRIFGLFGLILGREGMDGKYHPQETK